MAEHGCANNPLILVQIVAYVLAVVFGLCALVPSVLHLQDFNGHCLLFTNGSWQPSDGQFLAQWGSQLYCDYNIIWSMVSIIIALIQLCCIVRNHCIDAECSFLAVALEFVTCLVVCIAALVGGLFATLGYQRWCNAITRRFEECEDAASITAQIDRKDGIDTTHFYIHFGLIQFGAWSCWACWAGLSLCALLLTCSQHQDYVIRVSMAMERARLVGNSARATIT